METSKMYEIKVEIKDLNNGTTYIKTSLLKENDSEITSDEINESIAEDANFLLSKIFIL